MDMSNVTAAGPSRGLLDVLFGGGAKEGEEADGQEFMPLMNLIKALKGKDQEGGESSRTEEETAAGKGAIDYRVVGMPAWMPGLTTAQAVPATEGEEVSGAAGSALPAGTAVRELQPQPAAVDPKLVNQLLKEKSLPELTPEETKLLREVNLKMEAGLKGQAYLPESTAAQGNRTEPGAAPEKFLSTEAYLQMHERFAKGKQEEGPKRLGAEEGAVPLKAEAPVKTVVADADPKGSDLFGKAGREPKDLLGPDPGLRKPAAGQPAFGASLLETLKSGGELDTREVMLPAGQPEAMREILLGEMNMSVGFQAIKGGGEMRLVIYPEALGEVKLQVNTGKDGKVEVQVTAQNEEVARTIRSGSRELESSLKEQNLQLAKFDVSVSADGPVAAAENRPGLSEQFLPQNQQNGFAQPGNGNDRGFGRWDGSQGDKPGSGFAADEPTKEQGRKTRAPIKTSAGGSSRRLDVVA